MAERDSNLISLYLRHCGQSEVPTSFQLWACISMMAAAVRDTVSVEWFKPKRTIPNLYVFLIGPSGIGKEKAINTAAGFVHDIPKVFLYGGRITGPSLIDELTNRPGRINGHDVVSSPVYLITEELNMSVRGGEQAQDFISVLTKLYGRDPYPMREGTRMHGMKAIPSPCANWLAGSTEEWFTRSIPKDAIEGGFFARVIPVLGQKDYSVRYPRPIYPPDYDELRAIISQRVKNLTEIEGEITVSEAAWAWHDSWYHKRPAPEDKLMQPSFNRQDEMLLKLSMILSLAEWDSIADPNGYEGVIDTHHMEGAWELLQAVESTLPQILKCATSTYQGIMMDRVEEAMRKHRTIGHSDLLKKLAGKGLRTGDVQMGIHELEQRGDVVKFYDGSKKSYRWIGG